MIGVGALFFVLASQAAHETEGTARPEEDRTLRYCPGYAAPVAYNAETDTYDEGGSFDPLRCAEEPCLEVLHNIFEPLVAIGDQQQVLPVLATRWEKRGERTYRFWLREGVQFHNGEPFDARSVAFSLERTSNAFGATAWFPKLRSVSIVGPHVVDVTLLAPDSIFLHRLAHMALMQPRAYFARVGEAAFGKRPVGTGPFRFDAWDGAHRELHLVKNPTYWRDGYPKLEGVSFVYRADEEAYRALISGEIDLVRRLNPRKTTDFMRRRIGSVRKAWISQIVVGTFNLMNPDTPLADRDVREAINIAINREHLIRYGAMGNGRLVRAYTAPDDPNTAPDIPLPAWDPERARALMASAGVAPGTPLVIWIDNQVLPGIEIILKKNLNEIGFNVQTYRSSEAEFLKEVFLPKFSEKGFSPRFDILIVSAPVGTFEHASAIPMTMLYSGKPNESAMVHEGFDRRFEQALAADSPTTTLWADLERYVADEQLVLIGYQEQAVFGAHRPIAFEPTVLLSFGTAEFR